MDRQIQILILEDDPSDAELMQLELRRAGFSFGVRWAQDKAGFLRALDEFAPDLVLADYSLPGYDGLTALGIARQRFPQVPGIIVSGAIGEEVAIEALKGGATDYVLKQRLNRLGPAVRRALQEVEQLAQRRRTEQALRESETRFRLLVEAVKDYAIVTLDRDGRVVTWNPGAERLKGYTADEIIGQHFSRFYTPEDIAAGKPKQVLLLAAGQGRYIEEGWRQRCDGSRFWGGVTITAIHDETGELCGFAKVTRDLTERMRGEREREITIEFLGLVNAATGLRELVEAAVRFFREKSGCEAVGIRMRAGEDYPYFQASGFPEEFIQLENSLCVRDPHGQIQCDYAGHPLIACMCGNVICGRFDPAKPFFSKAGNFWTNCTTELLAGTTEADRQGATRNRCNGQGYESVALIALRSGEERLGLLQLNDRRKGLFTAEGIASWERLAGYLGVALAKARAEDALAAAKISAEQAKSAAEAANAAKDHFLSVLSHELRTPLTPVLMTASALESDHAVPAWMRDEMGTIRRSVELEVRLIDDLLDLNRIMRGKLSLRLDGLDAHLKIISAIELCRPDSEAKSLSLATDLSAKTTHLNGDAGRLIQIVSNLLKNAIKFTPAGGRIDVRTCNPAPELLRIEVTDTGIGIPPKALPRLFNAFEQADQQVTRQFGGLGLGLSICKALVEMHGGTVCAASEGPGKGATFTVELPVAAPSQPASAPAAISPTAAARRIKILVVEDHAITADLMGRMLTRAGHEVTIARSVREALSVAAGQSLDVLLSDLGLPDGSGLDIVREIRAKKPQIKAIALSGFGMDQDVERSKAAGFLEHITKPVEFRSLQAALERAAAS